MGTMSDHGLSDNSTPSDHGINIPTITFPDDGEVHFTPKVASTTGAEGVMFYNSADDHVYVGVE
jgi:hypothetical protein